MGKCREDYERTVARRIRDGRGLGEFKNYQPWIEIRDFSSRGRSHILLSVTTGREMHLLSDLEERVALRADYSPDVLDIREQFPLFPRAETQEIAEKMECGHPSHAGSNDVLTEDFVLTMVGTRNPYHAIQVKQSAALEDERVREKLEIQRRYFARRGIPWALVTERELSRVVDRNLKWLRLGACENFDSDVEKTFTSSFNQPKRGETLREAIIRCGDKVGFSSEQASVLFKRLVWKHTLSINLKVPIDLSLPVSQVMLQFEERAKENA